MDPLLDSAPFGFLVARDDGYVEAANRTLAEMLGTTPERLVGSHLDNILTAPSRIFYQSHFFPILKLQGCVNEVYVTLAAGDVDVPVLLNATRRETAEGPRNDWAVVPMRTRNDYENEILLARKVAESASRAKDDFIAFVSHELRSPLSAIVNWASLLKREQVDPTRLKRGLDGIERNAKLQLKLVDDMLEHSRLAAGKVRMDPVQLEARQVLETVLDGVEPSARTKGVEVTRHIDSATTCVKADGERLQQIFWNVLNNAVKFTPKGGHVRVCLQKVDGWVELKVADNGKGIAPEFLPFVFESYRQEDRRLVPAEAGLGLGMAITRQLVELHGGNISVASEGPERGATFTVRIPSVATNGAAATL
jgi:signal transduction histidine kinase